MIKKVIVYVIAAAIIVSLLITVNPTPMVEHEVKLPVITAPKPMLKNATRPFNVGFREYVIKVNVTRRPQRMFRINLHIPLLEYLVKLLKEFVERLKNLINSIIVRPQKIPEEKFKVETVRHEVSISQAAFLITLITLSILATFLLTTIHIRRKGLKIAIGRETVKGDTKGLQESEVEKVDFIERVAFTGNIRESVIKAFRAIYGIAKLKLKLGDHITHRELSKILYSFGINIKLLAKVFEEARFAEKDPNITLKELRDEFTRILSKLKSLKAE